MNGVKNNSAAFLIFLSIFALNAIVTAVHFIPMFTGHKETENSLDTILTIAVPDILFAVIPSLIACVGLFKYQKWGLWFAILAMGAYFHGQIQLLSMAFLGELSWIMGSVSIYFIIFCTAFSYYLWSNRELFGESQLGKIG